MKQNLTLYITGFLASFCVGMLFLCSSAWGVNQIARNLIRCHVKELGGTWTQWSYGEVGGIAGHGLDASSTVTAGGIEVILSVNETELDGTQIPGTGGITSVWVGDPVTGNGTSTNPIDLNIGTGLSVIGGELVNTVTDTTTPGGNDTEVQFNDGGVMAGDPEFTWNKTTNVLTISNGGASISIDGINDMLTASSGTIDFDNENLTTTGTATHGGSTYPAAPSITDPCVLIGHPDGSTQWVDSTTLSNAVVDLDIAHDNGAVIDYTDGVPIHFLYSGGDDPGSFWYASIGATIVYSIGTNGDFQFGTEALGASLTGDASASALSVVTGEFDVGDADTDTWIKHSDGTNNFTGFWQPPTALDNLFWWWTDAPTVGQYAKIAGQDLTTGAWKFGWGTPTDTDTDHAIISFMGSVLGITVGTSDTALPLPVPVPYTCTADYTAVHVSTWTKVGGADTLTVTLYVDGVAKDTWTTTVGATGSYGGAVSEALTQCTLTASHYVQIYAKRTVDSGTDNDAIVIQSCNMDVAIK